MIPNHVFVSIRKEITKLNFKMTISFKFFLININITPMERTIVYRVQRVTFILHLHVHLEPMYLWNHKRKFSKNLHSNNKEEYE